MDYLQLSSTILESIGLGMAVLDLRYPEQMKKVENFIDRLGIKSYEISKKYGNSWWYQGGFSFMILSVILIGGTWVFGKNVEIHFLYWMSFWSSIVVGSSIMVAALLGDFITMLNRYSVHDQAITTLGVFLAVLGFLLGIVQLYGIEWGT